MPTTEISPGDLCRASLYNDPAAMAAAIIAWGPPVDWAKLVAWLRAVADALEAAPPASTDPTR